MDFDDKGLFEQAEKVQNQMKGMQDTLSQSSFSATAGRGDEQVTIHINGNYQVSEVVINSASKDTKVIADHSLKAFNDAVTKVANASHSMMLDSLKDLGMANPDKLAGNTEEDT